MSMWKLTLDLKIENGEGFCWVEVQIFHAEVR
jgi:hypothetical protein